MRGAGSWLELWSEATRWWTQPAEHVETWGAAGSRLLAELVDGLAGRFEGRRIELVLGDRHTRATLDCLRLRRTGEVYEARVELREIDWDGWPIETLAVRAGSARVAAPARLNVTDIEVVGRSRLEPLIARLNPVLSAWQLCVDDQGRMEARRPRGTVTLVVEPTVREHQLHTELRGVRWHRLRLDVPTWLRLTRTRTLPSLAHRMSIVEATRWADVVEFRLAIPSISQRFDPGRLRDAISGGGPIPLSAPQDQPA
jgi:hypothetical protein